ncbi:MAG: Ig-like domain-containing protein [Saprospiraceae bacterium]
MKKILTFCLSIFTLSLFAQSDLIMTGVFDGPLTGGVPKGVELYVVNDIADLSIYGLGSASNGGGTDGEEYTFPAVSATAGDYIYVTNDSAAFVAFFGFSPDFPNEGNMSAVNINGDDAMELFLNGTVVDIYGVIDVDGTGEVWEYLDGWAYRLNGTGPDGSTFNPDNWNFSGIDVYDNQTTNATSPSPFPLGTYEPNAVQVLITYNDFVQTGIDEPVTINAIANDIIPTGSFDVFTLNVNPVTGTATANSNGTIDYVPAAGFCGADSMSYTVCDVNNCDTAWIFVDVICPPTYPQYTVDQVDNVDANGVADSLGKTCELTGILYGENLRPSGIQFTLIDNTGEGIGVFSFDNYGLSLREGDMVTVQGEVDQFNGLTQIALDTAWLLSSNNVLDQATIVTSLDESTESQLIKIVNLQLVDPADWNNNSNGFNVRVHNLTDTFTMRIDNDVDLVSANPPSGTFELTGIGGQFDSSNPYTSGYQILPRYMEDIDIQIGVETPYWATDIQVFPNPVSNVIHLRGLKGVEKLRIFNQIGQLCRNIPVNGENMEILVSDLPNGLLVLSLTKGDETYSIKLSKQ